MVYFFVLLLVVLTYYFYNRKRKSLNFQEIMDLKIRYRFQDHQGRYSGNLKSRHGSLVFDAYRKDEHLTSMVIRKVNIRNSDITVKLNQVVAISFLGDQNQGSEISVRFRMSSDPALLDLKNCKVALSGVFNYKDGQKLTFDFVVPIVGVYYLEESVSPIDLESPVFH